MTPQFRKANLIAQEENRATQGDTPNTVSDAGDDTNTELRI